MLVGNVRLRQGTPLFYCDSCVINNQTKVFEACGNVHINDSDTAHVYSKYLRYLSATRLAYLKGNVRLTDGQGTLTTNELEYDVASKIGTYKNGGRVVNKKTVLTSKEGVYYADLHDVYFKQNVVLKNPGHNLKTDSLLYNTQTQVARFIAETLITDTSRRTINTTEGLYDLKAGRAEFTQRTTINDGPVRIVGNQIASDDSTGIVQILGNGVLVDTAQGLSILANEIFADKKKAAYLATRKPLMIIKQEKDSIYITGDTLFSAKLSDLFQVIDTSKGKATAKNKIVKPKNDSTDRYFEAFRNVRVFTDSMQAVSDSLFYSFKDSTFQLFQNPIVWSNGKQLSGDTIYLYTKNKKADRVRVFENSFLISEVEPNVYNQIKAVRMFGYFVAGVIDSVNAKGMAESIYFLQDEDSAYSGINKTESDAMDVYFAKGELEKVVLRRSVKGTLFPANKKSPQEMQLTNFKWMDKRRPKTKYELFE
ncbi:MAG TPA: OstA-like protein, partial [Chitinophagaceae bacterium]|nr:OstA-like protein [Chitinophagaceae bacterium]